MTACAADGATILFVAKDGPRMDAVVAAAVMIERRDDEKDDVPLVVVVMDVGTLFINDSSSLLQS